MTFLRSRWTRVVFCLLTTSASVGAQIPRTSAGNPDFSGLWHLTEKASNIPYDTGIPFTAAGREQWKSTDLKNDPVNACLLPGVPRIMFLAYPLRIVQTRDSLVMLFEYERTWRNISLDGRPHADQMEPAFMGNSIGRWEGDVLTIDTIHFKGAPWTWLDAYGHQHSPSLHVVESLHRVSGGFEYLATIDDPPLYSRPWAMPKVTFTPLAPTAGLEDLIEYSCNENNEDLKHLVSTRAEDFRWNPLHPRAMLRDNKRGAIFVVTSFVAIVAAVGTLYWRRRRRRGGRE